MSVKDDYLIKYSPVTIQDRLKSIRTTKMPRSSVTHVSELIGLHPDLLRRYENGCSEPSVKTLIKIADFYGVSIDWLVGRTEK